MVADILERRGQLGEARATYLRALDLVSRSLRRKAFGATRDERLALAVFELRFLAQLGLFPALERCAACTRASA